MRTISKVFVWLSWIALIPATLFQGGALLSVWLKSQSVLEERPWLLPVWAAVILLPIPAQILLGCLYHKKGWTVVCAALVAVAAVLALVVLLALRDAFPPQTGVNGTQGLTAWRLCYRHGLSILAPLMTVAAALLQEAENHALRQRQELEAEGTTIDLSGKPLFRDESTLGLAHFGGDEADVSAAPRKLKRSLRHKAKSQS